MRNCTGQKQEKEEKSVFRKQAYLYEDLKAFLFICSIPLSRQTSIDLLPATLVAFPFCIDG